MNPHIKTLHSFLLREYPDGLKSNSFSIFYRSHPDAATAIRRRKLRTLCRDYPNLFVWTDNQDDWTQGDGTVKAIENPNKTLSVRLEYSSKIAIEFFNKNLRHDMTMRRKCEDRYFFDQIFSEWKSRQRVKGRSMVGCSPSQILFHLKHMNILDAKVDGGILLWAEDVKDNSLVESTPVTREDLMEQAKNRVVYAREELEKNQNGVEVDFIDFGYRDEKVINFGDPLVQDVTIRNCSFEGVVHVELNASLAEQKGIHVTGPSTSQLDEGDHVQVKLEIRQPRRGVTRALILFHFTGVDEWERPIKPFTIVRYIDLNVGNPDDHELIKAKTPYQKKKIKPKNFLKPIPFGAPSMGSGQFQKKLPPYGIPSHWRDTMGNNAVQDVLTELYYPERCPDAFCEDAIMDHTSHLTFKNYGQIFHRLLWTEEFQMEIDIRQYDMSNVAITRQNKHFSLNVPGLAESRPSVLRGDLITIQINSDKSKCFESYVDRVSLENAFLRFPRPFEDQFINGTKVDVRFRFRRVQLRSMHQALDVLAEKKYSHMLERVLFPGPTENDAFYPPMITEPSTVEGLRLYNRELNEEQKLAVFGAMRSVARPAPYLIYGPPGTGK